MYLWDVECVGDIEVCVECQTGTMAIWWCVGACCRMRRDMIVWEVCGVVLCVWCLYMSAGIFWIQVYGVYKRLYGCMHGMCA